MAVYDNACIITNDKLSKILHITCKNGNPYFENAQDILLRLCHIPCILYKNQSLHLLFLQQDPQMPGYALRSVLLYLGIVLFLFL